MMPNFFRVGYICAFSFAALALLSSIMSLVLTQWGHALDQMGQASLAYVLGRYLMDQAHLRSYARVTRTYQGTDLISEVRTSFDGERSGGFRGVNR